MDGRVEYEPASAKDLLMELEDTAELLVDLSFSAVLHGSDDVADEVLRLEERMDVLQLRARMTLLMAARSPEDAESLVRAELAAGSRYADRTLGDLDLETETGVRVIAIRREDHDESGAGAGTDWLPNPDRETTLRAGDVLLLRGPETGVAAVFESATGVAYDPPAPVEPGG